MLVGVSLAPVAPAFGAGTSYAPAPTPTPTPTPGTTGAPPGFTTVAVTDTIGPAGGTVSADGITVTIPPGDFTAPTQVSIVLGTLSALTGLPAGTTPVFAFGVVFTQNGAKVTGTFPTSISVTASNPAITSADVTDVYLLSSGGWVPVSSASNISGDTVGTGTTSFSITADPYVALLSSSATTSAATSALPFTSSAVPGATTTATGDPYLSEGLLGALLIAAGLLLAWRLRRSVRPS